MGKCWLVIVYIRCLIVSLVGWLASLVSVVGWLLYTYLTKYIPRLPNTF